MTAPIPAAPPRTFLPQLLFAYILVFEVGLYFLLVYLYGDLKVPFQGITATALVPSGWDDPVTMGAYGTGLGCLVAAFVLPASLVRRAAHVRALRLPGAGANHPLSRAIGPYIIRLCLLEGCAVAGFVLSFLRGSPYQILPLLALALAGTLGSVPTPGFFARFQGVSNP